MSAEAPKQQGGYPIIDPDEQVGQSHLLNKGYEENIHLWLERFEDANRAEDSRFEDVAALVQKILRSAPAADGTDRVAEIGSGTGVCVFPLARSLKAAAAAEGSERKLQVLASELTQNFLRHSREQLATVHSELQDVLHIVEGNTEEPGFQTPAENSSESTADDPARLPKNSLAVVTLNNTYHHIGHRVRFMRRLREEWLTPGTGYVFIQDLSTEPDKLAPGKPNLGHRLSEGQVDQEMRLAGYVRAQDPELLKDIRALNENTKHVYNMLFRVPSPEELPKE